MLHTMDTLFLTKICIISAKPVMKHHSPKKTIWTEHSAAQPYKYGTISSAGSVSTTTGRHEPR